DAAAVETFWCSYLYLLSTILIQIATQKNAREQNTHGRHYGPSPVALPAASGLAISPLSESQSSNKNHFAWCFSGGDRSIESAGPV
ncbi:MAG: hypothetical protein WC130_12260, partial [Kiritimatiellia bacterium]